MTTGNVWAVEIGGKRGPYTRYAVSTRFMDAWRVFEDITVTNGSRKRLLRNGRVVNRHIAPRTCEQVMRDEQLVLPVAG